MLFPYTYVPHQMEKMQRFINFIFYQVWCRAPKAGAYSLNLFDAHPPLKVVMESFAYDHNKEGDLFSSRIQAIYESFAKLPRADIVQFKRWYQSNNDIERVCGNAPGSQVARYAEVQAKYPELSELLGTFFKNLHTSSNLLRLKSLRDEIGDIDDHYHAFMEVNKAGKCPFCGIGDIKGVHHSKREAYDHYLPKAHYPFNSINFRNLAPTCHECNSTYKLSKDPAHHAAGRRKAFYPYADSGHNIEVTINLGAPDIDRLTLADIQLTFGPAAVNEEIATWKEVYGIEERYKAICCGSDAIDWLEQLRILSDTHGIDPATSMATLQEQTKISPVANSNFLKLAFLEGCGRVGVIGYVAGA